MLKLLTALAIATALLVSPAASSDDEEVPQIEDYASYVPQTTCHRKPHVGTRVLGKYLVEEYGGGGGATGRACGGGASEHKDGRAIDWTMNAARKADRKVVKRFLADILADDEDGNTDALARRMGIMYLIWNDKMYSAWDQFDPEPYLSSSCKSKRKCSKTLRHRDHMHISLSRPGAKGKTSWYASRG